MEKKRREKQHYTVFNFWIGKRTLQEFICKEKELLNTPWGLFKKYKVLPEFGIGSIYFYEFEGITVTIHKFSLKNDILLCLQKDYNKKHLSFLLQGESIIKPESKKEDILYADQESFLACFKDFEGCIRICRNKTFHEVNITFSDSFLEKHRINLYYDFKKFDSNKIIIPIASNSLNIINQITEKKIDSISKKIFLEAKILELLAIQMDNYKEQNQHSFSKNSSCIIKKLYHITQILSKNLEQNISLKELSMEVGINQHMLKNEFKRIFGCSVNEYAVKVKMQKAKELIENTQKPIYEIAEFVGYKNATHFSAAFKRYFHLTPRELRNNL